MKKILLALAASTAACTAAHAQSSLEIYGTLDLGADWTDKTAGVNPLIRTGVGTKKRLTPSMTNISQLGFRGTEDMGGGMKAGFVLEMQPTPDDGTLGNDGRAFGRQAFVSLTTPYGEIRAGRQYAPFFYAKAFSTTERLAGTDLFTGLLTINNLQVRQDNQVSYWIKGAGFTGSIAVSPNAGVPAAGISPARSPATNAGTRQILGGQSAGSEGRGRTVGAMLNYMQGGFSISGAVHANQFDVPLFLGASLPLGVLDDYRSWVLAARYISPSGWAVAAAYGEGEYDFKSSTFPSLVSDGMNIRSAVIGTRYTFGPWTAGLAAGLQEFKNFTRGRDTAVMLGLDYSFSKRTVLYSRAGMLKDKAGRTQLAGLINGGPEPILVSTGLREIPVWNGIGANPGGKSSVVSVGLRHSF